MSVRTRILLISTALLALTGCETVGSTLTSVRDSITSIDLPGFSGKSATEQAAEDGTLLIASRPVDCPRVGVVDDLNSITQLTGDSVSGAPISSARLVNIHSACTVQENNVIIDMDVALQSQLGPQGRQHEGDKPSFSYPYFVAITTPTGDIVAKEVFSATVAYDDKAEQIDHAEQLRQVIPLTGDYNARDFEILIGFQLSPAELDYNRKQAASGQAPAATTVQTLSAAELAAATLKAQEEARAALEAQRAFEESEVARLRALKEQRDKEDAEKLAAQQAEQEQAEKERAAKEQAEKEQAAKELAEKEQAEKEAAAQAAAAAKSEQPALTAVPVEQTTPATTTEADDEPLPDVTAPHPRAEAASTTSADSLYEPLPTNIPPELEEQVRAVTPSEPVVTAVEPLYPVIPGNAPPPPRIIPRFED